MSAARWAFAGGGTGGHVTPMLALAEVAAEAGDDVVLFGSAHGLETRLVPQSGFELVTFGSRQFVGRGPVQRARSALGMLGAVRAAFSELGRRRPDVVVSVGGYAAVPAVLAGALRRIPVALVEPNAEPGRANLASARFAARVFCGFARGAEAFAGRVPRERVQVTGIPLRRALVEASAGGPRREPIPPLRLLVFGGSQGARQINEAMMEAAPALADAALEVVHQTGEADRERVAAAYAAAGLRAEVVAFEPDMPRRYAWADFALCRAGALTVGELLLAGLPALLVPYPYAAGDHQAANARECEAAGAARMLEARPLRTQAVTEAIRALCGDPGRLRAMGESARKLARPDAARAIVRACRTLAAGD